MMSNKWAFSLTTLITIFAFAFVAPSAMAGDFSTTITVGGDGTASPPTNYDISHADGEQRTVGTSVVFNVTFGQVVEFSDTAGAPNSSTSTETFEPGDFIIRAYDVNGAVVALSATSVDIGAAAAANGKEYTVALTIENTVRKVYLQLPQGKVGAADPTVGDADDANEKKDITVTFLEAQAAADTVGPTVLKIARVGEPFETITSAEFMVHVLLSEDPKGGFTKDLIEVSEATVSSVLKLASPTSVPMGLLGNDNTGAAITASTTLANLHSWRDMKLHLYLVTLATNPGEKTVTIKVKDFAGMERPAPGSAQEMYNRAADSALMEGRDKLTVKTKRDDPQTPKTAGLKFGLPKDKVIPEGGYLVVAESKGGSSVHVPPGAIDASPKPHERTPAEMIYNVIDDGDLPNLETFLANGGVIGVMGPQALMVTEIMWGSDASLVDPGASQWIELHNAGDEYKTEDGDNTTYLVFYGPGEAPATGLHDTVGTVDETAGYWALAGKGQSGASGGRVTAGDGVTDVEATVQAPPISPIISMVRVMDATGALAKGTLASSWTQSTPPSSNFDADSPGVHIGSPGAMPVTFPEPPAPAPEPEPAAVIPPAEADDIMITEIMVNTNSGRLPQWIELTSVATGEVSLEGWEMVIDNAIDADVLGGGNAITVSLSGVTLDVSAHTGNTGKGQSALVVAWSAPRMSDNIRADRVLNVGEQLGQTRRYQLLSYNGFRVTLVPPDQGAIAAFGDIAGNLDEDWELPMDGRTSLIRREMLADGTATMGTDANGWTLASSTTLTTGQPSYYGDDEDQGTPGHDAGGPLPVELSHFRPARDKATGAVVITWATESELNNAGFFIKRSNQRNGEFKVINAAMVPGAGTTSEKQFYTYTDTTAQPNVVYYYQIEDVSLDGNRQTLTRGIRLKGHVGAAGKLTSTWGELKTSHE